MHDKMWAILVHLGYRMWEDTKDLPFTFDEELWDYIVEESAKIGINTIVLDVGEGLEFSSHPELFAKGGWTRARLRKEIARCEERGIKIIPKLNFSAYHDQWLGEYGEMLSTSLYYKVCADLIRESYEIFHQPEYIHIGMDEEDEYCFRSVEHVNYRKGSLYWHDLRFLLDCVIETGAKPWIWSDPLHYSPEEFCSCVSPDEVLISPWYYHAFKEEHYTPINSRPSIIAHYQRPEYANMKLQFVEEDPINANWCKLTLPYMEKGYNYVPCAGVSSHCDYNTEELVEYYKENAPDDQVVGYMTAPWYMTEQENKQYFEESFRFLKAAKEKFYHYCF